MPATTCSTAAATSTYASNDILVGDLGDDTYLVRTSSDFVVENPGEGIDTVIASAGFTLQHDVENFDPWPPGAGAIEGFGNDLDNVITGNESDNVL